MSQRSYLLVIGDGEALAWILSNQQMAFPWRQGNRTPKLAPGDNFLLYTTRGCFGHYNRDQGRVIAHATVSSRVAELDVPVKFSDRTFPVGCSLNLHSLAPYGTGVVLADQAARMHAFPNPRWWSVYIRRTMVALDDHDYTLLLKELRAVAVEPRDAISQYVKHGVTLRARRRKTHVLTVRSR